MAYASEKLALHRVGRMTCRPLRSATSGLRTTARRRL